MRLLVLAVSLSALGAGSFWVLTSGPLAPGPGTVGPTSDATEVDPSAWATGGGAPNERLPASGGVSSSTSDERPAVRVQQANKTYAVTGRTADEVLRSLLERGPREGEDIFFGLTQTALDVRYDATKISGGCIIKDTEVDLDVVVTLPEWMPAAEVEPELLRDWGRFRRALAAHEERHRAIAVEGAEATYRAVAELYRPSCEEAEEEARGRLERIGIEITAAHRRFDAETGHGKSEGASWPVR